MKGMNKMRTSLRVLAVVWMLLVAAALSTGAANAAVPGGGPAFGQHVAGMAPEHARTHGAMFGQCVSTMARTGTCPHHP
jgi:hypothetical protein